MRPVDGRADATSELDRGRERFEPSDPYPAVPSVAVPNTSQV
jgi:hypothetical protein